MAFRHNHHAHPAYPAPSKKLSDAVAELEARRKSKVILLIEGTPGIAPQFRRMISSCTYSDIRTALSGMKFAQLDLLISSNGGLPDEAFKIARLLQRHSSKFSALVPEHAKSAATMICLGASEIVMTGDAELGPIDMQIQDSREPEGYISALQEFKGLEAVSSFCHRFLNTTTSIVQRVSQRSVNDSIQTASEFVSPLLRPLFEQVDPRVLGGYRRALEVMENYAERLLMAANYDPDVAQEIVYHLVYDYPSHGFVINVDEAADMGLRATPPADDTTERLMETILEETTDQGHIGFVQSVRATPAKSKAKTKRVTAENRSDGESPTARLGKKKQNGKPATSQSS